MSIVDDVFESHYSFFVKRYVLDVFIDVVCDYEVCGLKSVILDEIVDDQFIKVE